MQKKLSLFILIVFSLGFCSTMSAVSAANVYNITNESYINYFDESGYINDSNVVEGDIFDYSGTIIGKDMYIDRPLNITSTDKTGKIINGTIYILPEGSGTNITGLYFNNTNHNGPDYPGTIVLDCASKVTIANNTIITNVTGDDSYGIHMVGSSDNIIISNQVITTGDGSGSAAKAAVDDTGWPGNGKFTYGVYLDIQCCNNWIESNLIHTIGNSATVDWSGWGSGNGGIYPLVGLFLYDQSSDNTIKSNTIHTEYNQEGGVYGTILGVQIKNGCSNNKLLDNNITTNGHSYGYGVEIVGKPDAWSNNNLVSGNNINTTADRVHETQSYANGIKVSSYTENTVLSYNDISAVAPRFTYSIYLEDYTGTSTKNITVIGNKIYGSSDVVYLIEIWLAKGNTISNNTLVGVGNRTMAVATADSDSNLITYNTINLIGDDNAPMGSNVDAIPAINAAFTLTQHSDNNRIEFNIVTANGAQYTIHAERSANNQFTYNILVSSNGNVVGDASIVTGEGDIVSGNSGELQDNPSNSTETQTNSTTSATKSDSGLTPGLLGAISTGLAAVANLVSTSVSEVGDQASTQSSKDSSKVYEVSQKNNSSSSSQSDTIMVIVGVLILLGLLFVGFFRNNLKSFFKRFTLLMVFMLFCCAIIGAVDAANVYNITNESYGSYFNEYGNINNTNIVAGDVLDVSGTLYNKNMTINRPLNITSSDKTGKLINGTIKILASGSGSNVTSLTIENHNLNGDGIHLYYTENNTIQGNYIYCEGNTAFALPVSCSNHNNIIGNTIITCQSTGSGCTHTALPVGNSTYNIIRDNYVFSDGANCISLTVSGNGNFVGGNCYYNSIINNTIVGSDTELCIGINICGAYNQAINNTILSQTFPLKKTGYGNGPYIGIQSSSDEEGGNTIIGNFISASSCGILVNNKCIVSGNTIFKNNTTNLSTFNGIQVVNNCFVVNNTLNMLNGGSGFLLTGNNSTVSGNNIINVVNGYGIKLQESSNNTITANNIITTDITRGSIHIYGLSMGNSFTSNIINSKSTGFTLERKFRRSFPQNNIINSNQITTSSNYAVDSRITGSIDGTPSTTITNNYLVSDNGNKMGDLAVYSLNGGTVFGNYGDPPVANFTVDTSSGTAPLTVHFTDTSTNHPTSWMWNFGDGNSSTEQNPTHTYNAWGIFNVTLTVNNSGGGSSEVKTGFINVLGSVFNSRTNSSYVSIQGAIDDVSTLAGDIIIVNVGNYTENVVVNKNLVLSALGFVNISALNSSSPVFLVTGSGSGSTIAGFVISGGSCGVCFGDADNCNISNNTIQNNLEGVLIQGDSDNNLVEGNVIRNSTWNGVLISGSLSNQNRIINSEISGNGQGITLSGAVNNLVLGNNVTGNGWAGIWLYGASNNVIGIFNVVSGNMEGIVLQNYSMFNNVTGNVIRDNAWNGVLVPDASSTGNRIVNNTEVSGNDVGIKLYYATLNVVEGNNVTGNDWAGIWLYNATYNTIGNANTVSGNQEGIVLQNNANNNVISGNIVRNNTWNGILIPDATCSGNVISQNTEISGNNIGIDLFHAIGNTVQGNNASANNWAGIWVYNAVNNTINSNNTVSSNSEGIFIENSSNIVVSGNSLVNNLRNGVYVSNSSLVRVTGNGNVSGNQVGVGLAALSSDIQVLNNTITGNSWAGVWANNAHDSTIIGNLISGNGQEGVLVENGACNVTVSQNIIRNNSYHGVIVVGVDNNTIDNNTEISGNNIGILLQNASGNLVSSNLVTGSGWIGVCVLDTSLNNQVLSNNITNNPVGVRVDTDSSSNVVNNNSITGSQYGLTYAGTKNTLNATNNWWGSNDDPASQIHGNVSYAPWITQ
nr:right-handed parallel beta-helix repeat-containing protein [uncultured Methanobacterium sp.]